MAFTEDFNYFLAGGNYEAAKALQAALGDWAVQLEPNIFLTVTFNRAEKLDRAKQTLRYYFADLEKQIIGDRFYNAPVSERIIGVAFIEDIHTKFHYHIVAKVPRRLIPRLQIHAARLWKKRVKSGTSKIYKLTSDEAVSRSSGYSEKKVFKAENFDNFVVLTEFWNRPLVECSQQSTRA